jgi:prepilin-type processing-associated H-X9-DG protein
VVALGTNSQVTWTRAIHKNFGNLALADGSVSGSMQTDPEQLRRHLRDSGDATNRLVFPQ